jgi:outer membrane lipoprotein-sorting protein
MLSLTRRAALVALSASMLLAAAPALAAPDPQNDALVARAVAYLDAITSVKGRFQQSNEKGGVADGTLYLARPGRARFEYDPPSGLVITSDGRTVVVTDSKRGTAQHMPLSSTPLAIFLADHIRLDHGVRVTRVDHNGDSFSITARGNHGLGDGQIVVYFKLGPNDSVLRLTGWAVTDAGGHLTRVTLGPLTSMATPAADYFSQPTG